MFGSLLPRSFYARNTLEVAQDLLSKLLVSTVGGVTVTGRIVEVEAYRGSDDLASHAGRGRTPRNEVMFGDPGSAYVYLSYGVHNLLNAVTEPYGSPGAVLIRALEPVSGLVAMSRRRGTSDPMALCSGPGRLTAALGVDRSLDRSELTTGELLAVYDDGHAHVESMSGPRIGISRATELPWRIYLKDCPFVSRVKAPGAATRISKDGS